MKAPIAAAYDAAAPAADRSAAATPPRPNVFDTAERPAPASPAPASALAHNPRLARAFAELSAAAVAPAPDAALDPKLRELAYLAVSAVNGCAAAAAPHGAYYHHRRTAVAAAAAGLSPRQIDEVARFAASDAYDPLQKHVIRYAVQVARDVRPSKTLVATLRERLSEAELRELTFTIGLACLTNRFHLAHGTELP